MRNTKFAKPEGNLSRLRRTRDYVLPMVRSVYAC